MKSSEVYDSFRIRDEIGMLADTNVSDKKYLQTVRNAMEGIDLLRRGYTCYGISKKLGVSKQSKLSCVRESY
ncbi:hypothetical protein [Leptospira weilii]|uniref:Uncharacterized protein n=1 Tax=Leptospira weilii str. UI 13098 TaxID=1088542 RepID=M6Q6Y8_9LEPT|nr:hypothetical protein [Leptospira weilii]EMN91049.1 hypothetical protein LEP1GSC108_4240 [Leptospira weilii str. UI 13098]ULH29689.1 hypothetical protein FH586_07460 [Leptospira weilii]UPY78697.1 hypothetical protein FH581_007495 [Leptospira weilii]